MVLVGKHQERSKVTAIPVRLPRFGWIVLSVLTGVTVLVASAVIVTRRDTPDPFSSFGDLFADNGRQAALSRGFTCRDTVVRGHPQTVSSFCIQDLTDEVFSRIYLRTSGDVAKEIRFSLREHTLRLGDLALLWGRPTLWLNCEAVIAAWPAHDIIGVVAPPQAGRVNYFLPVISVSFTRAVSPNWGRVLMNDVLHNCGSLLTRQNHYGTHSPTPLAFVHN
ncbi:MAG: hypothetical protein IT320_18870 [Anaerolineae bacterium]|nr:hypothetical protein [Anaerolineae bacterium]